MPTLSSPVCGRAQLALRRVEVHHRDHPQVVEGGDGREDDDRERQRQPNRPDLDGRHDHLVLREEADRRRDAHQRDQEDRQRRCRQRLGGAEPA